MNLTRRSVVMAAWVGVGVLTGAAVTGVAMAADQAPTAASRSAAASTAGGAAVTGTAAAGGHRAAPPGLLRLRALGPRVLHGQLTVRTKAGTELVDTQLGTVTARTSASLTVTSTDGYVLTWALGPATVVRAAGTRSTAGAVQVGQTVRLLGPVTGTAGAPSARLVLVRGARHAPGGAAPAAPPAASSPTTPTASPSTTT